MKYLPLAWSGLWRSRTRTTLTLLSALVAFLLFGVLQGVDTFFSQVVERAHLNILLTSNPAALPMPIAYLPDIKSVPGVTDVTYMASVSGYFRTESNHVNVVFTDPRSFFHVDYDMHASIADRRALLKKPTGALITPALARKYGWKRGDIVSIHSTAVPKKDGSSDWQYQIVGYLNFSLQPEVQILLANYKYLDLSRSTKVGTVLQYLTLIKDPAQAGLISTKIDEKFVNSPVQTRTMDEKDLAQSQLAAVGNIDFFVYAITAAVFFTLLLLAGNSMMQSFRERISEFAVLKTLGFSDIGVATLIAGESLMLSVTAAILGLAVAWFALPLFASLAGGAFPHPPPLVGLLGLGVAVLVGLICGAIPAWQAGKLRIADALAKR